MNTGPARGMRDFLPEDVRRRQYVIGVIADVYQRYGFEPLETPAVENLETLQGKYGDEGDQLIFKILKRGEGAATGQADLALRYDLTVPLARVVAEYRAKLPRFFKRYQVQPVWRADRPQKGRFREFYQCDVDAIGSTSMVVEAELLSAAADVFIRLGFADFRIRLNHRALLTAMLQIAGIPEALHGSALVALDKLDKLPPESVEAELVARGATVENVRELMGLAQLGQSVLDNGGKFLQNALGAKAIDELHEIGRLTRETIAGSRVSIDLTLARGLSYYTGPIFEITVPDLAGSLGGGGRYDNLIGMFCGEHIPASGISLGLERILVVMAERRMFPDSVVTAPADVMLAMRDDVPTGELLKFASELRAAGIRIEVFPEAGKLDKQFKYAASRNISYVAVIGGNELVNGTVAMKNMTTREQTSVNRAEVVKWLSS